MFRNRFLGFLFAFMLAGFLAQNLKILGSSPIAPPSNSNYLVSWQQIDVATNDFAWDETSQTLYVSVSGNDPVYGNTILPIAMPTGTIGISIPVGLEPQRLALTDDGAKIYVGINGEAAVKRVNIISGTVELGFELGTAPPCGNILAEDMVIPAGQTDTVIIARKNLFCSPGHEGVTVYDNGVKRPETTQDHTGSTQQEPSGLITTV